MRDIRGHHRTLRRRRRRAALVLVMEGDLQADDASRLLLEFLAKDLRGAWLLVVGTYRNLTAEPRPRDRRRPRPAGPRGPPAHPSGPGPAGRWGADPVALSGAEPSEAMVAAVHEATEGRPAVRPRDRAAPGHRRHPGGPWPAALPVRGERTVIEAAAGPRFRRRRPGAVGGRSHGPGVRPGTARSACGADRARPGRALRGPGWRVVVREGGAAAAAASPLPDPGGPLRAAADPGRTCTGEVEEAIERQYGGGLGPHVAEARPPLRRGRGRRRGPGRWPRPRAELANTWACTPTRRRPPIPGGRSRPCASDPGRGGPLRAPAAGRSPGPGGATAAERAQLEAAELARRPGRASSWPTPPPGAEARELREEPSAGGWSRCLRGGPGRVAGLRQPLGRLSCWPACRWS